MGNIKLSIGQINITEYLIVNIRETASPGIVVDSLVFPPPVLAGQNIVFTNVNNVPHWVDMRRSSNGTDPGLLLSSFIYDVKEFGQAIERRFYQMPVPADLTDQDALPLTDIVDPYLEGKIVTGVFLEHFRYLWEGIEYVFTDNTIMFTAATTGFNLAGLIAVYDHVRRTVIVEINNMVALSSSSSSGGSFPSDIVEIVTDITLDSSHYNKLMEAKAGANILTVTLPAFNTIPDKTKIAFNTDNADALSGQRYMTIVIDPLSAYYAQYRGKAKPRLHMGKGEYLVLQKKGGYMRVLEWRGDADRVGELVYADEQPLNSVPETGGWINKTGYPRLFEFVNNLSPALLGTGAWPARPSALNAFKWVIDPTVDRFWVPDSGGFFVRNSDPNGDVDIDRGIGALSGSIQGPQVGQFTLTLTKANGFTGAPSAGDVNKFAYGAASPTPRSILMLEGVETRPINIIRNAYRII